MGGVGVVGTRPEGCEQSGLEKAGCRAGQGGSRESRDDGRAGLGDAQPERKKLKGWGVGVGVLGGEEAGSLPGHAVVGRSETEGGAEGVGLRGAGAPSGGHCHGLFVHHAAVLAALGEEGGHSEGLGWGPGLRHAERLLPPGTSPAARVVDWGAPRGPRKAGMEEGCGAGTGRGQRRPPRSVEQMLEKQRLSGKEQGLGRR